MHEPHLASPEGPLADRKVGAEPSQWQMTHGSGTLAAPSLCFDLDAERRKLLVHPTYAKGGQASAILVKELDLRVVIICLRRGARMERHSASGPISVQPFDGRLRFVLPDRTEELSAGNLLVLEPGVSHDVEAIEDSTFLLTIGRTRYPLLTPDND